jgi:hypothetical protein
MSEIADLFPDEVRHPKALGLLASSQGRPHHRVMRRPPSKMRIVIDCGPILPEDISRFTRRQSAGRDAFPPKSPSVGECRTSGAIVHTLRLILWYKNYCDLILRSREEYNGKEIGGAP